jgi:MFS family permease
MAYLAVDTGGPPAPAAMSRATAYSWLVFALCFGLLISDYMARQVLNAVFPLLKAEWHLTDGELGLLSGVVAIMVGVLTFPLSLLADRWGRVRCLTMMAVLWSLATLLCGVARNYEEMLAGRLLVGVGEAAYGSVGIALVLTVFPVRMRATLAAAFMAGGLFGQVLGVGIGGQIAAAHGWRTAFIVIALAGLALAIIFPLVVRERRIRTVGTALGNISDSAAEGERPPIKGIFGNRAVLCAYVASGLQLYVAGAIPAWLPTYFVRYHHLALDRAARLAALFLLISGAGMILCGMLSDRLAKDRPERKISLAITYCLGCAALLALAFHLAPGPLQLAMLGGAVFFAAATTGPAGAMVANLTPRALHGTAFATLTLANNLLGLAPGPIVTGKLADTMGLLGALQVLPVACLLSVGAFLIARRSYLTDLAAVSERGKAETKPAG